MAVVQPRLKLPQVEEAMDYVKFGKAVRIAWEKAHPDIPLRALGSKDFSTSTKAVITFHIQRRTASNNTPKPRLVEAFNEQWTRELLNDDEEEITEEVRTERQDFENEIVFTIHVPIEKGGGEVADMLAEEFERFMLEHTRLFMTLGAKNLRYLMRFHDDNLLNELSQTTVKRFISYTLYTQKVTQVNIPLLRNLEVEIRARLDSDDTISTLTDRTWDDYDEHDVLVDNISRLKTIETVNMSGSPIDVTVIAES